MIQYNSLQYKDQVNIVWNGTATSKSDSFDVPDIKAELVTFKRYDAILCSLNLYICRQNILLLIRSLSYIQTFYANKLRERGTQPHRIYVFFYFLNWCLIYLPFILNIITSHWIFLSKIQNQFLYESMK